MPQDNAGGGSLKRETDLTRRALHEATPSTQAYGPEQPPEMYVIATAMEGSTSDKLTG